MSTPARIAVIGVGGIGGLHIDAVLLRQREGRAALVATADPNSASVAMVQDRLASVGARNFDDYREMLDAMRGEIDLVIIATPHHLHLPMATEALAAGMHVLLEKPPVVTIQDHDALTQVWRDSGRMCLVGFHQVVSKGVQALKQLVVSGALGRVARVSVHTCWFRPDSYYQRNSWAGQLCLGDTLLLDGPTMNPLAHGINNALYVASDQPRRFATPVRVWGELYRAHRIAGEDTSCARIETDAGVDVLYLGTLCALHDGTQTVRVHGGRAVAELVLGRHLRMRHNDGREEEIDITAPVGDHQGMIDSMLEAVAYDVPPGDVCNLEDTRAFMLAANGIFESSDGIGEVAAPHALPCVTPHGPSVVIPGIEEILPRAAEQDRLLSEMDLPWGRPTGVFDLEGYRHFTGTAYRGAPYVKP